jgi:outer membrane immunogenic protein
VLQSRKNYRIDKLLKPKVVSNDTLIMKMKMKMNRVALLAAITVISTSTMAMAGSHDILGGQVVQTSTVSTSSDWSGFYLGGSFGTVADGSVSAGFGGSADINNATPVGAFLGYQNQTGNMVFGVEYATAIDGDIELGDTPSPDTIAYGEGDLKARLGYDFGKVMGYGVVSSSAVIITDSFDDITAVGLGFGFGADYAVSDNVIVGAEFMVRDLSEVTVNGFVASDLNLTANSLSIRAAYKF